jgi:hypothetical protein
MFRCFHVCVRVKGRAERADCSCWWFWFDFCQIATEMGTLNDNIAKWSLDLTTYEDIEMLRTATETKKRQLLLTRTRSWTKL